MFFMHKYKKYLEMNITTYKKIKIKSSAEIFTKAGYIVLTRHSIHNIDIHIHSIYLEKETINKILLPNGQIVKSLK